MGGLGTVEISDMVFMFDRQSGKITLQFSVPLCQALYAHQLWDAYRIAKEQEDLQITLAKTSKKRSLSQNAYAWRLMQKIAEKKGTTVESIYNEMLLKYGVPVLLRVDSKQKDSFFYPHLHSLQEEREIKRGDDAFVILSAVCGSSTYTKRGMGDFLEGVIGECKKEGINPDVLDPRLIKGGGRK